MNKIETIRPYVRIMNTTIENQNLNLSPFLLHITTSLNINQPAGSFQIDLIPAHTEQLPHFSSTQVGSFLERVINKGDIISIGFRKEGTFLGRIEAIQFSKTYSERPNTVMSILGRNLGGLLLDDDIVFAPELAINDKAKKLLGEERVQFLEIIRGITTKDGKEGNIFYDQNPLVAIVWILLNMPSFQIELDYKNYNFNAEFQSVTQKTLGSLFCTDLNIYQDQKLYDDITLTQYAGKVWNYILRCLDPIFYEVFVDTVTQNPDDFLSDLPEPRPCLVVRPRPFDRKVHIQKEKEVNKTSQVGHYAFKDFSFTLDEKKQIIPSIDTSKFKSLNWAWDDISNHSDFRTRATNETYHTIPKEEILDSSQVSNIVDVYNYYIMKATKDILANSELANFGFLFPLIDAYSVKKYGMRKLEAVSNLLKVATIDINQVDPKTLGGIPKQENSIEQYLALPEQYVYMRDKLFYWYRYSPILLQSQRRIYGNENIRIGDRVYFPDDIFKNYKGYYFYVEGVSHNWEASENNNTFITTLTLTRGENPDMISDYDRALKYDLYDKGDIDNSNIIKINYEYTNEPKKEDKTKEGDLPDTDQEKKDTTESPKEETYDKVDKLTQKAINNIKGWYNTYKNKATQKFAPGVSGEVGYQAFGISSYQEIVDEINSAAQRYGVNANVIAGLIICESGGDPFNVSSSGASGLGQFTMGTAKLMDEFKNTLKKRGAKLILQGSYKIKDPDDVRFYPLTNIRAMAELLKRNGFDYEVPSSWKKAINKYTTQPEKYNIYRNTILNLQPGLPIPE